MGEATFRGRLAFCSNFHPSEVRIERLDSERLDDLVCPTVEHAFAASKTLDPQWRSRIAHAKTPGEAKRLGRQAPLRPDWENVKICVMKELLEQKFEDPALQLELLKTGDETLVEGNWWHDNFWGSCTCPKCGDKGQNMLGKLLMEVRDSFHF